MKANEKNSTDMRYRNKCETCLVEDGCCWFGPETNVIVGVNYDN